MRKIVYISSFLLLGAFLLCGCGFGILNMQKESSKPVPPSLSKAVLSETATLHPDAIRIENTSLIIASPFKLGMAKEQPLGALEPYIKDIVGKIGNDKDICIVVNGVSFDTKKIEMETGEIFIPNLEGALTLGLENMKNSSFIKNLQVGSMQNIKISGLNGKEMHGSCTFIGNRDVTALFRGIACYHGGDMFCVIVFFPKGDSSSERIVDSVFDSIMVVCHNKKK